MLRSCRKWGSGRDSEQPGLALFGVSFPYGFVGFSSLVFFYGGGIFYGFLFFVPNYCFQSFLGFCCYMVCCSGDFFGPY